MRSKFLAGTAIAAVLATSLAATTPADARWRGRGGGGAFIGGLAAGALLGGALAARPYYYGGPGYYYDPYYAPPPPPAYYGGYEGGGDVEYCMRRFKSYDPASGTYRGYDGYRHSCP